MIFSRCWCMPSKNTFEMKPVRELIEKYLVGKEIIIDPFANKNQIPNKIYITNDLDPQYDTIFNKDAVDFLSMCYDNSVDMVLYDPPYSARQVSESYKKLDMSVDKTTTQSSYWSRQKIEIARIMKKDGIVISFGWNSCGIGKVRGFEIIEILIISHGGNHNDTICTVERKIV